MTTTYEIFGDGKFFAATPDYSDALQQAQIFASYAFRVTIVEVTHRTLNTFTECVDSSHTSVVR